MSRIKKLEKQFSSEQLLTGITLGEWIKLLQRNDWNISKDYIHRLAWLTGWAVPSSVLGRIEDAVFARRIASQEIDPPPLFILGHWRSGTTHLQNLLCRDPGLTAPTLYQAVFTSHFLLTGKVGPKLLNWAVTDTRSYDNVKLGWFEAAEDEIALAKMTGLSLYAGFGFPDNLPQYEKYMDFLEVSHEDRQKFMHAMEWLIKKIMVDTGGTRVVVKSCAHTARIRMLVERFPNAQYLFIHRNPYETFASMMRMRRIVNWENYMHRPEESFVEQLREQTALAGETVFNRYLEDRHLIPEGRLHEIAYGDFAGGNELAELKKVWDKFSMPDWDRYERTISPYLDSIKGYKRNKLEFDDEFKDFVYNRWRMVFDAFGYPKEYPA